MWNVCKGMNVLTFFLRFHIRGGRGRSRVARWIFFNCAFNFALRRLIFSVFSKSIFIFFYNSKIKMVLKSGLWLLTLVEWVGLSVILLQRASEDWDPTVWFFILTIPATGYLLFSFSTTSQTANKGFFGECGFWYGPNMWLNHSGPRCCHAH